MTRKDTFSDDKHCFACGAENPIGLKLKFDYHGSKVITEFTPHKIHQGFKNVVHGGIIATLLDEAMAHLCVANGFFGVTAKIEVKFKKPARVGEPLKVKADLLELKGRTLKAGAEVINQKGEVLASGSSIFIGAFKSG